MEVLNDRDILASYLFSSLSETTNPETTCQFKVEKDSTSIRVNDLLIHNSITITLYDNLLKFRDTGKLLALRGDPLKMTINSEITFDPASLSDKKLLYDFAKEMYFNVKATGNKSTRDLTLIELPNSPSILVSASSVSKTIFLSSDPNEHCDKLKLLLEEKQAGNKFEKSNDEIIAIDDKVLEYKNISTKHYRQILIKCNLIHTKIK